MFAIHQVDVYADAKMHALLQTALDLKSNVCWHLIFSCLHCKTKQQTMTCF